MKDRSIVLSACVLVFAVAAGVLAAPEPSRNPKSWQLDFEYHDLQRIDVVLPGDKAPTTFWYMLYTVTNNTGREVDFYPTFELVTDTFDVVVGGDRISPTVYDVIKARHKRLYPFFRDPIRASGKLLQGPDNARTSAAVFRDFDPNADQVTVYVAGLSGEIQRINNPSFEPSKGVSQRNPRFFTLRKSLGITYDLPSDSVTREAVTPVRRETAWVMR